MRLVCISDVHGQFDEVHLLSGDVLVIAGDLCEPADKHLKAANGWVESICDGFRCIVYVPGNHDLAIVEHPGRYHSLAPTLLQNMLVDSEIEFEGVHFYGMPYESLGRENAEERIPDGIDVLVTHEPPYGILDEAPPSRDRARIGNAPLRRSVLRIKPRVHIFGHAHFGHGMKHIDETLFANVAVCGRPNKYYGVAHKPTVIDI